MISFLLLNQLRCCRSRLTLKNGHGLTSATSTMTQKSSYCSDHNANNGDGSDEGNNKTTVKQKRASALGQTVILVQQGTELQELPMILRRYGPNEVIAFCSNEKQMKNLQKSNETADNDAFPAEAKTVNPDVDNEPNVIVNPGAIDDSESVVNAVEGCTTSDSVLHIINEMTDSELRHPDVLVTALDKIMRIETINGLKALETTNETYQNLIDLFSKQCDTRTLLDMLEQLHTMLFMSQTIDRICEEILLRNADTCLSIVEICESIERFVQCQRFDGAEKFWSGIADQESTIDAENIKFVFQALPKLKVSRRAIVKILDRVIVDIFPLLKPDAVCDILMALKECRNDHTKCILKSISWWLNTNIHAVNETQLETIVHCLTALPFSDPNIERALARYMKAKATKIKAQTLIVELAKHVTVFRLLNAHVLNGCAEFFIANATHIEAGYVRDILRPFGLLHYQPLSSSAFWQTVERYLDANFDKISPAHVVDIMLIAIILEMYPVNFVERIFNRYFMHTLHSTLPMDRLPAVRFNVKLIDTAMTLECNAHRGPILPRTPCDAMLATDNRIKCVINDNIDIITMIAGGKDAFTKFTVPHSLPYNDFYVIDILFHPAGLTSHLWSYFYNNSLRDRNIYVAALIHLPEHYESSQQYLIGSQRMRIRHLRRIGLKVVSLNYERLTRLGTHKEELRQYVVDQMKQALSALEPLTSDQ